MMGSSNDTLGSATVASATVAAEADKQQPSASKSERREDGNGAMMNRNCYRDTDLHVT